ncbi:MAG: 50S ribosomal protein L10 [Deltaproteobacteria bacterium]|nr:50S ribosomal protein L10 [Deltaproteobacteria bacterium]
MDKTKKEAVVSLLKEDFATSKAVFVTDFKSLSVATMAVLRNKIRQNGGQYRVVKNTLVKLASVGHPVAKLDSLLVGNNGFSFTKGDPAALAKALQEFAKENNKFVIKGGILGDRALTKDQIQALAALPSREVLLSSFLGSLQAVPTKLARVFAAVPQKLLYALAAVRDQKAES